jgi:hypothetical protein
MLAELFQKSVRFRQILATGAFAFIEVGHGVQAQTVHAQIEPEVHHFKHRVMDGRRVVIQVGLVGEEPMPEMGLGDVVPGPVGLLDILKDDTGVVILRGGIAPDIKIAPAAAGLGPPGALKPRVLVGGVVENQFGDDSQPTSVSLAQKRFEVCQRAVTRMHRAIIGDVIAVVLEG